MAEQIAYLHNTEVLVCAGIPLDNKYNDTILFKSEGEQQNYFSGKAVYRYNGSFSYQRVQNKVNNFSTMQTLPNPRIEFSCRIPVIADKVYRCNYLCFKNNVPNSTPKWWYCFIKDVNYINPECTEIIYEIDVFQTWLFDFTVEKSFVEREHVSDDGLFKHICLENEICKGNYVIQSVINLTKDTIDLSKADHYIICPPYTDILELAQSHGGSVTTFESKKQDLAWFVKFSDMLDAIDFLNAMDAAGKGDSIALMIATPKNAHDSSNVRLGCALNTYIPLSDSVTSRIHNNMLFCFPFQKVILRTSANESCELYPELFCGNNANFRIRTHFTGIDYLINVQPVDYYNNDLLLTEKDKINAGKLKEVNISAAFPTFWFTNAYANWYAQNIASVRVQAMSGVINATSGLMMAATTSVTGNPLSIVTGMQNAGQGVRDIMQAFARMEDAQHLPDNVHGNFGDSSFDFEADSLNVCCYNMRIDDISLERIDQYFTRYGYKVNQIKVPSPFDNHKRNKFNFVKTVDVNITGSIPVQHMNIIKSAFDRGITFWHNPNVGEYSYEAGDNDA